MTDTPPRLGAATDIAIPAPKPKPLTADDAVRHVHDAAERSFCAACTAEREAGA